MEVVGRVVLWRGGSRPRREKRGRQCSGRVYVHLFGSSCFVSATEKRARARNRLVKRPLFKRTADQIYLLLVLFVAKFGSSQIVFHVDALSNSSPSWQDDLSQTGGKKHPWKARTRPPHHLMLPSVKFVLQTSSDTQLPLSFSELQKSAYTGNGDWC